MAIEIVAGTDSTAFLLAVIDVNLLAARNDRDRAIERAGTALLAGAPVAEHMAMGQVNAMTMSINCLLDRRLEVMGQG